MVCYLDLRICINAPWMCSLLLQNDGKGQPELLPGGAFQNKSPDKSFKALGFIKAYIPFSYDQFFIFLYIS